MQLLLGNSFICTEKGFDFQGQIYTPVAKGLCTVARFSFRTKQRVKKILNL